MSEKRPIERLTARKGQEERLAAILERRRRGSNAALAAVEAEARQQKRSLFKLAEVRAERLGVSTADLFARDRATMEESDYPGEQCLQPYEIELYAAGRLSDERIAHARECAGCGGLTAALGAVQESAGQFLSEVRAAAQEAASDELAVPSHGLGRPQRALSLASVSDAAAATVIPALTVAVLLAALPRVLSPLSSALGAVGQVAIACVITAFAAHHVRRSRFLRASGGALVGSFVVAVFAAGAMWLVWRQGLRAGAEARVTDIAAASLLERRFVVANQHVGPLSISSWISNEDEATYSASAAGLPRMVFAELRPDHGELYWAAASLSSLRGAPTPEGPRDMRAKLIAGTVRTAKGNEIVIVDAHGSEHALTLSGDRSLPRAGHRVVAVVEPEGAKITALYELSDKR